MCDSNASIEINLGAAMAAATAGAPAPDEATRAAAMARAATMVAAADAEGLRHLQNLTLSMGLPAARACFRQMATAHGLRGALKAEVMAAIKDLSPITEKGCMKVDFFNVVTERPDAAYLRLDQCPRTHDLGAQLAKLRRLVSEDKWSEVTKALSHLLLIGRSVYGNVARQHVALVRKIVGPDGPIAEMCDLKVDPENTTLYLREDWPSRVGFFVALEAEIAR